MAKAQPNAFSQIFDNINIFDDLVPLDESLTGTFKIKRKTNNRGIANVKATFSFKDDILQGLGFKKVKFKDRNSSSLFGDFGDDAELGNPRTVRSGSKKYDYLYNGTNSDILKSNDFDGDNKKLVELSILPSFINTFESDKKQTVKGTFRVNLDDNFIALSTSKGLQSSFEDNLILRADYESAFDFINPDF